jgi:hypothetical protein
VEKRATHQVPFARAKSATPRRPGNLPDWAGAFCCGKQRAQLLEHDLKRDVDSGGSPQASAGKQR